MPLPRPSRRTLKGLAALAVLGLVFLVALAHSLRSVQVRQAILERVTAYLERDLGIVVQASEVDFDRTGGIDLRGLRIGAPGAPPFATAEQARIVPALRSLTSDVIVLRSVEVVGPRIDLDAPVPEIRQTPPEPGARTRRIDVLDFRIDRGEIVAAPLSPDLARWVESWGVRDLSARGSYRGEKLDLEARAGEIQIRQPGQSPQLFRLEAKAAGRLDRPLEIRDLRLTGDGLALTASGTAALAAEGPFSGRFRLDTEPGRVVPRLVPGGRLQAAGSLAYPGLGGQVSFQARDLPAETVRGFVDPALYADLSLAGTVADANGDVTLPSGAPERAHGPIDLTWRRENRALARVEIQAAPEPGPAAPLKVAFQGDLLPRSAGKRHIQGSLLTPSWAALLEARNQGTRVQVQSPDLAASLAELRALWPRLVPKLPPDLPVRGSLQADAWLKGPFTAPLADLDAVWQPDPGARVAVQAQHLRLPAAKGAAQVEIANLPLGTFATGPLAGLEGTLSGTADLEGSLRAYRTRMALNATGVRVPVPGGAPATLEAARVNADGTLRPQSLAYDGTLVVEGDGLIAQPNASSTARIAHFRLSTGGTTELKRSTFNGFLTLEAQDLALDGESPAEAASFFAQADGRFSPDLRSTAALWSLRTDGLRLPALLPDPIEATALGRIADGEAWIPSLTVFAGDRAAAGTAHLTLDPFLREADLDLQLSRPFEPAARVAEVAARLRQGVLTLDIPRLEGDAGTATLQATVPLGALDAIPELRDALAGLPVEHPQGPVSVAIQAPALDSATLLAALCLPARPERLRTGLDLALTVDPRAPAAGTGEIRLTGLQLETGPNRVTAEDDLVLRLANAQLAIPPVRLRIEGPLLQAADPSSSSSPSLPSFERLSLQGTAVLSPTWQPGQPPADLVTRLAVQGAGTVEAALLNPYLEGGIAEGPLTFKADLSGPLATLDAKVELNGSQASFFLPGPFPTRLEGLDADLTFREGKARLEGSARLNGGPLTLDGDWDPKLGGKLSAVFTGARYRLPDLYNLSASLSGLLRLDAPAKGRWTLGGALIVDRGVINRDIDLDQQVLAFLAPREDAEEADAGLLGQIDLELTLTTVDGVRVQNNIGDLRAVWSPLVIRGTLAQPDMRGRIDLEPGGLVFAYGQTVRIDRGALVFTGPINEPEPELSVTTSLQDPTIGRLRGRSPLDELDRPTFDDPEKSLELERSLTEGVAGYYGERFASRLGSSLGLTRFTIRPVLVFQETDPTARLTVSRELSPYASFALSLDLRNAERQSYLLDLYGLRGLPRLTLQGYRTTRVSENIAENTVETYGGTLQQTLELGGSAPKEAEGPRLRRILFDDTGGLSRRRLRRALAVDRGDALPASAAFDLEEDLAQALGRRGYPDARVTIQGTAVPPGPKAKNKRERADLHVTVNPGPHVTFAFAGKKPPRSSRSSITGLYRTDFYEPTSLEEMKSQTVRVFRSLGYLDPRVSLEVQKGDQERTVTIRTEPGRRAKIETVVPEGLAPDAALALLAGRLQSRLARAELAAAVPAADRRLLADLDALGYPDARIAGRALSEDGKSLSLQIEAGPRRTFGEITLAGVEGPERDHLRSVLRIQPGDPAVTARLARAALDLEDDLKRRGHDDATVRPLAVPSAPGQMDVRFDITPGTLYRIQTVAFEGERFTSETALENAAQLPAGAPLSQENLNQARNRLFQTGLFSRVLPDIEKDPEGQARVTFQLQERPRFRIAYGLRWDSEDGTSAVVDLVDQNLLGRGLTLGLRTLYEPNDQSGRLFFRTGGLFGSRISLESFGEYRHIETEDDFGAVLLEDRTEAALQLSRPFGTNTTGRLYLRRRSTWTREQEPDPFLPLDIRLENTYLGVQTLYDTRNDLLEPTRGLFATLDLSGSGAFLGSDFEYARAFGQLNTYRRLATWNNRPILWAQSTRLGVARPFAGQELLRDVSFFAGGEYSVRGYDKESLGPREDLGGLVLPSGGEALVVLNQEIRFPLPADLTGLVFFDLGQVWRTVEDVDGDLAKSVGFGLRARTPLGLLRGDVAFPLDGGEGERGYRFYLGFGNVF